MKYSNNPGEKRLKRKMYLGLAAAGFITWLPILFTPFLNDDYQILGFHEEGFWSVLNVFWTRDISGVYWRPVGNLFHPLIKTIAGFHPLPYRLFSLLLYIICASLVMRAGQKTGLPLRASLLAALLFLVLPSHEFQVAWIADQGESIVTIFLLLAFINYINIYTGRNKRISSAAAAVFFILAILVKESAYAGVFIPFIALAVLNPFNFTIRLKNAARDTSIGLLILAAILVYRYLVIGGTPFESGHFAQKGIFNYLINFLLYFPLSFFSPEILEQTAANFLAVTMISAALAVIVIFSIVKLKRYRLESYYTEAAGLLWFVVFILPAIPTLMRWYVFTASIGLVWAATSLFNKVLARTSARQVFLGVIFSLLLVFAIYDFSRVLKWQHSGKRFNTVLADIPQLKQELQSDTILVWCATDKIDDVPFMKLGIQQTLEWGMKKKIETISPLRSELSDLTSYIKLVSKTDTSLVFHLYNGRFLIQGGRSRSVVKPEMMEMDEELFLCRINTFLDKDKTPHSRAEITLKKRINADQVYFNGTKFIRIKSN